MSVTPLDPHFFHWAMIAQPASRWKMYFGKKYLKDRHELPPVFRPNGAIKIANIAKLRRQKNFFGKNLGALMMPEERSLHVVSATDVKIANVLLP